MKPENLCDKFHCENEAEFDSIFADGGRICRNHATIEVEDKMAEDGYLIRL